MQETLSTNSARPLAEGLRTIPVLSDLSDEQIEWIVTHSKSEHYEPGAVLFREGDLADSLFFIVEGHMRFQKESLGPDAPVFYASSGQVSGMLPYSRMTHATGTVRILAPTWLARVHTDQFPEMLQRIPQLGTRLVAIMSDRIRESTKLEQQRDKLTALGKLSAGLAHEMNNPAAAASRAAAALREALSSLSDANSRLDQYSLDCSQRTFITDVERNALQRIDTLQPLDPLEASDREDELGNWLEQHDVKCAWQHAPVMAEFGVTTERLENLASQLEPGTLSDVLDRVTATVNASKLAKEIQHSISRITDLVSAVKEYSYMDQAPEQEIDIHDGLESTLTIMAYKLRKNQIEVVRDYDRSLPKVCAFGRELNQVWTNLIDNAADAMKNGGRLRISTRRNSLGAAVDIEDTGSGIPAEIQQRIFEPFFTTKAVGEGTGLGLDTVVRVIRKHRGEIRVESKPGETHFRVQLPAPGVK